VTLTDLILSVISKIGAQGARGFAVEFCGSTIDSLSIEARMTLCNMAVEAGARAALVAPDADALAYLRERVPAFAAGTPGAWAALHSDDDAVFDAEHVFEAGDVAPFVTWGTSPDQGMPVTGRVPAAPQGAEGEGIGRALRYMGLNSGEPISGTRIDRVFIGSCTNSRIEDLRAAAAIVGSRKVAAGVRAMVVPGSGAVRRQAELEGLDQIFIAAGFEWRLPGCSMCLAMNNDVLAAEERCASTSNRNFEGRQGRGGRTHLMSPTMAAAAAITGAICDVRSLGGQHAH
jgi:3-isopropylmalate/(R)-2-methylmalate dehydratase large subunit